MPRTNPERVKAVLRPGKDYDDRRNPDLTEFIAVATAKVDHMVADCATYAVAVPSSAVLATLETWVAAWAYKNSDQQLASSSARSSASFKGVTGKGLESNHYGQTAIELDPTGLLQTKAKGATLSAAWTGKRPSEQLDYIERD